MAEKKSSNNSIATVSLTLLGMAFALSALMIFVSSLTLDDQRNLLDVSGSAEKEVEPNKFSLSVGVEKSGENAREVENQVREQMNDLIEQLKEAGLEEDEMQTTRFTLNEDRSVGQQEETQEVTQFRASQQLQIESEKIDEVSQIIDTAISAGANNVGSLNFRLTSEKEDEIKKELIEDAVDDAKDKADRAAQAADTSIIGVAEISLQDYSYTPFRAEQEMAAEDSASLPEIETGRVTVSTSLNLKYKLS